MPHFQGCLASKNDGRDKLVLKGGLMQFDKTQRDFPSKAHRIPWYLGTGLLPFSEVIPESLSREESRDLAIGEKSLHSFLGSLYSDMYQRPQTYFMEEIPDLYFNDGEWFKRRPDMTKVRNKNTHVMKALEILFEIAHQAVLDGDVLIVGGETYERIINERRPKSVAQKRISGFWSALRELGLEISKDADACTIRSEKYPKITTATKAMARHGGADDKLRFFAFYRCDFAAVNPSYLPDISRILSILPADSRVGADKILEFMTQSGYGIDVIVGGYPSSNWNILFSGNKRRKASQFFWMGFSIEYYNMFYAELHCMNPKFLIPIVYGKGEEYGDWFNETWTQNCTGCGYCRDRFKPPGPYIFEHRGKKRGLCHQQWISKRNPSEEQINSLLKMVELHTEAGTVKI